MELNSLDAIAALVKQGLGTSIVPMIHGATWHKSPRLHIVPVANFYRSVSLIARTSNERDSLKTLLLSSFSAAADLKQDPPVSD